MPHAQRPTILAKHSPSSTSNLYAATSFITTRLLTPAIPHPPSSIAMTPYFMEDEKVKFGRVLQRKMALSKPTSLIAHWPVAEGVQPLISEIPPPPQKTWYFGTTRQPSTSTLRTRYTVKGRQQISSSSCRFHQVTALSPQAHCVAVTPRPRGLRPDDGSPCEPQAGR